MLIRTTDLVKFHELTGNEMLAVGARVPAHADELWADLSNQDFLLVVICHGQRPLKDIIYISGQMSEL